MRDESLFSSHPSCSSFSVRLCRVHRNDVACRRDTDDPGLHHSSHHSSKSLGGYAQPICVEVPPDLDRLLQLNVGDASSRVLSFRGLLPPRDETTIIQLARLG